MKILDKYTKDGQNIGDKTLCVFSGGMRFQLVTHLLGKHRTQVSFSERQV